jgi:hypothetical protein
MGNYGTSHLIGKFLSTGGSRMAGARMLRLRDLRVE